MLNLLLLVALCYVADCQVSKKCQKANKAYPGNVNIRPAAAFPTATCDMFAESCCSMITEYYMREEADKLIALAMSGLSTRLVKTKDAIRSNSLTPIIFNQEFNDLVRTATSVSYRELSTAAIKYYIKDSCANNDFTLEIVDRITSSIRMLADPLKAVYVGLDTIKTILEIATEYKTSDQCREAIMRNGIGTDNMCQVCDRETATLRACKNTCVNTVRGCLSDLTEMGSLVEDLANALDISHYSLLKEREEAGGSLEYIEMDINGIFSIFPSFAEDCSTGEPFMFVDNGPNIHPVHFTGLPLEMKDAFTTSFDHLCLFSTSNTDCWNGTGLTSADVTEIMPYASYDQVYNPVLPKETTQLDGAIINGEAFLRDTIQLVNQLASSENELELPEGPVYVRGYPADATDVIEVFTEEATEGESDESDDDTDEVINVIDDDKSNVIDGETDAIDGETDAINGETSVIDGETDLMEGETNVIDAETNIIAGETDAIDGETDVIDGKTGVVDGDTDTMEGVTSDETRMDMSDDKQEDETEEGDYAYVAKSEADAERDAIESEKDIVDTDGKDNVVAGENTSIGGDGRKVPTDEDDDGSVATDEAAERKPDQSGIAPVDSDATEEDEETDTGAVDVDEQNETVDNGDINENEDTIVGNEEPSIDEQDPESSVTGLSSSLVALIATFLLAGM